MCVSWQCNTGLDVTAQTCTIWDSSPICSLHKYGRWIHQNKSNQLSESSYSRECVWAFRSARAWKNKCLKHVFYWLSAAQPIFTGILLWLHGQNTQNTAVVLGIPHFHVIFWCLPLLFSMLPTPSPVREPQIGPVRTLSDWLTRTHSKLESPAHKPSPYSTIATEFLSALCDMHAQDFEVASCTGASVCGLISFFKKTRVNKSFAWPRSCLCFSFLFILYSHWGLYGHWKTISFTW